MVQLYLRIFDQKVPHSLSLQKKAVIKHLKVLVSKANILAFGRFGTGKQGQYIGLWPGTSILPRPGKG